MVTKSVKETTTSKEMEGKCYAYWKKSEDEPEDLGEDKEDVGAEIERLADEDMDRMEKELDTAKEEEQAEKESTSYPNQSCHLQEAYSAKN